MSLLPRLSQLSSGFVPNSGKKGGFMNPRIADFQNRLKKNQDRRRMNPLNLPLWNRRRRWWALMWKTNITAFGVRKIRRSVEMSSCRENTKGIKKGRTGKRVACNSRWAEDANGEGVLFSREFTQRNGNIRSIRCYLSISLCFFYNQYPQLTVIRHDKYYGIFLRKRGCLLIPSLTLKIWFNLCTICFYKLGVINLKFGQWFWGTSMNKDQGVKKPFKSDLFTIKKPSFEQQPKGRTHEHNETEYTVVEETISSAIPLRKSKASLFGTKKDNGKGMLKPNGKKISFDNSEHLNHVQSEQLPAMAEEAQNSSARSNRNKDGPLGNKKNNEKNPFRENKNGDELKLNLNWMVGKLLSLVKILLNIEPLIGHMSSGPYALAARVSDVGKILNKTSSLGTNFWKCVLVLNINNDMALLFYLPRIRQYVICKGCVSYVREKSAKRRRCNSLNNLNVRWNTNWNNKKLLLNYRTWIIFRRYNFFSLKHANSPRFKRKPSRTENYLYNVFYYWILTCSYYTEFVLALKFSAEYKLKRKSRTRRDT